LLLEFKTDFEGAFLKFYFVLILPLLGPLISSKCKRAKKVRYFFPLEVIQMQSYYLLTEAPPSTEARETSY